MPADFHCDFHYWIGDYETNPQQVLKVVSFILFVPISSTNSAVLPSEHLQLAPHHLECGTCR